MDATYQCKALFPDRGALRWKLNSVLRRSRDHPKPSFWFSFMAEKKPVNLREKPFNLTRCVRRFTTGGHVVGSQRWTRSQSAVLKVKECRLGVVFGI